MDPEETAAKNIEITKSGYLRAAALDAQEGMGWWNELTEAERADWSRR